MPQSEPEGLLLVDKPAGPTSHDVVAAARRALRTRRIGHTGTLDPFASGLLLLLVGRATRLAEYFDGVPKQYRAVLRLGEGTDTDDRTGEVNARASVEGLDAVQVRAALLHQVGERLQKPPAYSAKKVAGQRAYEAAREGRPLVLEPARVHIMDIRTTSIEIPVASFEVTCGAGTYIRAIARDAGDYLGVPAHLVELRRTAIGAFRVDDAIPLADLIEDAGAARLLPPVEALAHLPRVEVDPAAARQMAHGMAVAAPPATPPGPVAVVADGDLIAVATVREGLLAPRKVLARA